MLKGSDEQCVASRWEISRISVGGGCQAAGRTGGKEGRGGGGWFVAARYQCCGWYCVHGMGRRGVRRGRGMAKG